MADLVTELKKYRLSQARLRDEPAFKVFPDSVADAIAERLPTSIAELEGIKGLGNKRIFEFGEDIVRIVAEHGTDRNRPNAPECQTTQCRPTVPEEDPWAALADGSIVPGGGFSEVSEEPPSDSPESQSAPFSATSPGISGPRPPASPGIFLPAMPQEVMTVGSFVRRLNAAFSGICVSIRGEITECGYRGGHAFFSLKDPEDSTVLAFVAFQGVLRKSGVELEEGMEVVVRGSPDIYPVYGKFSIKADFIELAGEGALKKAYEALKAKLSGEGLFDPGRKKPLPEFVRKIWVITSRNGEVIKDFRNNLAKFGLCVELADSRVEGVSAVSDLLAALDVFRSRDVDVVVMIRGGGSLESLQSFNSESLVRAVADFPVPVLCGIGHDADVPLVCLAASGAYYSTPTAVAVAVSEPWRRTAQELGASSARLRLRLESLAASLRNGRVATVRFPNVFRNFSSVLRTRIEDRRAGLVTGFSRMLDAAASTVEAASSKPAEFHSAVVRDFERSAERARSSLRVLRERSATSAVRISFHSSGMSERLRSAVRSAESEFRSAEAFLKAHDPTRILALGYALVRDAAGKVVRSVSQVRSGDRLSLSLADGSLAATVSETLPAPPSDSRSAEAGSSDPHPASDAPVS